MSDANKAVARRFYDELSAGRLDVINELVAQGFVEHEELPGFSADREGLRQLFTKMRAAFPDLTMSVEHLLADGDIVVVRGSMKGTHRGEFMGMAPTGKQMAVPFADFIRFTDGKAVEHWGVTDTGAMMQQLT